MFFVEVVLHVLVYVNCCVVVNILQDCGCLVHYVKSTVYIDKRHTAGGLG